MKIYSRRKLAIRHEQYWSEIIKSVTIKAIFKLLSFFLFLGLFFNGCKKYPEGGLHVRAVKHLITDDNDAWQLKLYSVNGIDSTYLIKTGNDPNYYNVTMVITQDSKTVKDLNVLNNKFYYHLTFQENKSKLLFSNAYIANGPDTKEILNPENLTAPIWTVEKLKDKELILTARWNNSYKLVFEKHKL